MRHHRRLILRIVAGLAGLLLLAVAGRAVHARHESHLASGAAHLHARQAPAQAGQPAHAAHDMEGHAHHSD